MSLLLVILVSALASAVPEKLTAQGGEVGMIAIGRPSFMKIHGKGEAPTGYIEVDGDVAQGEFEFDLNSLETGIDLRDKHMRDKYLEVAKHPSAKLKVESADTKKETFEGKLTLHGVTKPVSGKFSVGDDNQDVSANFKVKLSDFAIDVPKYMGVTVADEVEVQVKIAELVAN